MAKKGRWRLSAPFDQVTMPYVIERVGRCGSGTPAQRSSSSFE
jgi:hypothetical protein